MARFELGDYVKVEFKGELEPVGEWMWVRVESSNDDQRLVFGVLDSGRTNATYFLVFETGGG